MAQMRNKKTGVLLVNLGSPDAPGKRKVRRYLREFLSDPRVVNLPRSLWWFILNFLVLPFRPGKAAKAYRKIWTEEGSPLTVLTRKLAEKLNRDAGSEFLLFKDAMRYGRPALAEAMGSLKQQVDEIIVLPLYPQFSSTTTASVFDVVDDELRKGWHLPSVRFISDYHDHEAYIRAVSDSIQDYWSKNGKNELLLMSFHGLPARLTSLGDPYYHQCLTTAKLIAESLSLKEHEWKLVFQSRFGKAEWLKPYCVEVLQQLPEQGHTKIDIVCPGFAVDCLETLEEIAMANKEIFLQSGGHSYRYIPALNDSDLQSQMILQLLELKHERL